MEKFVDRIIETDRKAREIIEKAQQEKQAVLADAKKNADAEIARLQQLIAIAQTARNAYSNALLEEMKVKDETPAEKPKKARKPKAPKAE